MVSSHGGPPLLITMPTCRQDFRLRAGEGSCPHAMPLAHFTRPVLTHGGPTPHNTSPRTRHPPQGWAGFKSALGPNSWTNGRIELPAGRVGRRAHQTWSGV